MLGEEQGNDIPHPVNVLVNDTTKGKTLQLEPQGTLPFLFRNVDVLHNKISIGECGSFINKFPVLSFQETWSLVPTQINGYMTYHMSAMRSNSGRAKGGLAIFMSTLMGGKIYKYIAGDLWY